MKRAYLSLLLILALAILGGKTMTVREFELEVWRLTNVERNQHHLPTLNYDEGLADMARLHSQNMVMKNFFAHKDHLGDQVGERRARYYPSLLVTGIGENLGKFTNSAKRFSPEELVRGWMQSPLHRDNILTAEFTHLGVGLVFRGETLYATQNFATPIAKLKSELPKSLDYKKIYRLSFEYLSTQPAQKLTATLLFPDKRTTFKVSDKQEMVGAQPIGLRWTSANTFEVDVPFNAGKGVYQLCFGYDGAYFPEGLPLRAK